MTHIRDGRNASTHYFAENDKKFIFKIAKPAVSPRLRIGRSREIMRCLSKRQLCPRPIESPQIGEDKQSIEWLCYEFVEGVALSDLNQKLPEIYSSIGALAARLHSVARESDVRALINDIFDESLGDKIDELSVLCHGDLNASNIIRTAHGDIVVDFEDSTVAAPEADLASSLVNISESLSDFRDCFYALVRSYTEHDMTIRTPVLAQELISKPMTIFSSELVHLARDSALTTLALQATLRHTEFLRHAIAFCEVS